MKSLNHLGGIGFTLVVVGAIFLCSLREDFVRVVNAIASLEFPLRDVDELTEVERFLWKSQTIAAEDFLYRRGFRGRLVAMQAVGPPG